MTTRLPFTKIIHNPTKPELVLANGHHFLVLNTSTGELIKSYPADALDLKNVTDYYRSLAFNKDGNLLATSGENKEVVIWNTSDWSVKTTKPAYKRINAVDFNNDSTFVLAADKFGDVYNHSLNDNTTAETVAANKEGESEDKKQAPILGHVSMVTDMLITPDDKYVVTSDRDEHIRVSRYPNGYNIESFCLGHTDVITVIELLPWNESVLVSSGGDGTVRLWDFVNGKQLQVLDLKTHIEAYKPPASDANSEDAIVSALSFDSTSKTLAVAFAKSPAVLILAYNTEGQFEYKETVVTESPVLDIAFDLQGQLWIAHDGEKLVSVWNSEKEETLVEKINKADICRTDKVFDLYTIFGLRKFLELPENLIQAYSEKEEQKSKKRKVVA